MNTKNLEFLKESLKYLGFGDKLNVNLEDQIKQQPAEFKLNFAGEFDKDSSKKNIEYTLDFKKSDQSDMYFLNKYQATLKNENPELDKTQTFYITKNSGVTAKEAFNLLSGRAVQKDLNNKEGQPFNAWLQLDLNEKDKNDNYKIKYYNQGYGFELELAVNKYPIKELGNAEDKDKLMKSLKKGNLQQVTFIKEGREEKVFVEANPQYKTLNLYDSKMDKMFQGIGKRENHESATSTDKKDKVKQDIDDDNPDKQEKKRSNKRGVGI